MENKCARVDGAVLIWKDYLVEFFGVGIGIMGSPSLSYVCLQFILLFSG